MAIRTKNFMLHRYIYVSMFRKNLKNKMLYEISLLGLRMLSCPRKAALIYTYI